MKNWSNVVGSVLVVSCCAVAGCAMASGEGEEPESVAEQDTVHAQSTYYGYCQLDINGLKTGGCVNLGMCQIAKNPSACVPGSAAVTQASWSGCVFSQKYDSGSRCIGASQ